MGHTNVVSSEGCVTERARTRQQTHCPMCSGVMIPLGEHFRCSRCFFDFCVVLL